MIHDALDFWLHFEDKFRSDMTHTQNSSVSVAVTKLTKLSPPAGIGLWCSRNGQGDTMVHKQQCLEMGNK